MSLCVSKSQNLTYTILHCSCKYKHMNINVTGAAETIKNIRLRLTYRYFTPQEWNRRTTYIYLCAIIFIIMSLELSFREGMQLLCS